jgi:hypothetical protein
VLRRRFKLASGEERCLCLPLDHPIDVLRGEGVDETEDLSDIGDDELLTILPDMSLALATKGMLLQRSAFCMTAGPHHQSPGRVLNAYGPQHRSPGRVLNAYGCTTQLEVR